MVFRYRFRSKRFSLTLRPGTLVYSAVPFLLEHSGEGMPAPTSGTDASEAEVSGGRHGCRVSRVVLHLTQHLHVVRAGVKVEGVDERVGVRVKRIHKSRCWVIKLPPQLVRIEASKPVRDTEERFSMIGERIHVSSKTSKSSIAWIISRFHLTEYNTKDNRKIHLNRKGNLLKKVIKLFTLE